jgi:uncharacterized membrane protein YfcA
VRWRSALLFAATGMVGAFGGSTLGKAIDGERLVLLFALLMIAMGLLMLRPRRVAAGEEARMTPRQALRVGAVGLGVGVLSGFFGIGGGFLIVPGLINATNMPILFAVGSSLVSVAAFGLATASSYAIAGLVDWHVAALLLAGGIVGALIGTALARKLAAKKALLARIFAVIVMLVGLYVSARGLAAL